MKKKIALLLAALLLASSMLGLTSLAADESDAAAVTPSQEIKFFNVSTSANVHLLFAVPAKGYTASEDGKVSLQLLLWEGKSAAGLYSYVDAKTNGVILESSGKQSINGEDYLVFSYAGLSAAEMTTTVYARALWTDESGYRHYGTLIDYSIAEFANGYLNRETSKYTELVEAMLEYGADVESRFSATPAQSYKATDAKELHKITVISKIGDKVISEQVTQLAKSGEVTLTAPHVDGASFVSWDDSVSGGKINVTDDVTVTANYEYKVLESQDFNATNKFTPGAYISTAAENGAVGKYYPYAPAGAEAGKTYYFSGYTAGSEKTVGSYNLSIYTGAVATAANPTFGKFEVCADGDDQYMKYAHNGTGRFSFSSRFNTTKLSTTTGVGDTTAYTFEISLKPDSQGRFADTDFTYYKIYGNSANESANKGSSYGIFSVERNGNIQLSGTVVEYQGIKTNVIAVGDKDKFTDIAVTMDFANNLVKGYARDEKGEMQLTAVTSLSSTGMTAERVYYGKDNLSDTGFYIVMTGGFGNYGAGSYDWTTASADYKTAIAESVVINGVETPLYDSEAKVWNLKAVEKYVDENYYLCYDNYKVSCGAIYD